MTPAGIRLGRFAAGSGRAAGGAGGAGIGTGAPPEPAPPRSSLGLPGGEIGDFPSGDLLLLAGSGDSEMSPSAQISSSEEKAKWGGEP